MLSGLVLDHVGHAPSIKSLHDRFFMTHHGMGLAYDCPKVEKSADGRFVFPSVRPGKWLLRVHHSGSVLASQVMVEVHHDVIDLGELSWVKLVAAQVRFQWQGERPGRVRGVWLRARLQDGQAPVWAGTFSATGDGAACTVVPGRYLVIPFGLRGADVDLDESMGMRWLGITGEELAEPVPIEIRSDGTVVPNPVPFSPLPAPGKTK